MLMGEYEHTLDAKGRISMPAKLRKDMGDTFILTKGLDGCLFAFSQEEWATECEIDKQGRFLIPSNLREAASLEKEAAIIGVGTRLEIWNKSIWQSKDEEISAEEIAENMTMLGI